MKRKMREYDQLEKEYQKLKKKIKNSYEKDQKF